MKVKHRLDELALYGGPVLFDQPRSTSNLVAPDLDRFLEYSRVFHEAHQFSNNGPLVRMLEQRLAAFHQTRHCVTFCSGFWALVLAMKCLAREGGEEVVMPSLTYRRMADVVSWAGLRPRFCEVEPATLAISARTARSVINEQTALLLGVHPIINCCDASGLEALSAETGIPLLIDAVESGYEHLDGRKVGSFGRAECFSLHASKLINGFEGGYVTTDDAALAEQLGYLRGFGFCGPDVVTGLGMNAKLNEMHAAMALANLDGLAEQVARNRRRYLAYDEALRRVPGLRLLKFDEREACGYKNIVVELTEAWPLTRAYTLDILQAENIVARAYYAPALHMKAGGHAVMKDELALTEALSQRFMLLPCGHFVDEYDIEQVVDLLAFMYEQAQALNRRRPS